MGRGGRLKSVRFVWNAIIILAEIAAVAGIAWLGLNAPLVFAGVTAALVFVVGLSLELARLRNEMPFYFDRVLGEGAYNRGPAWARVVAVFETSIKALLGGLVALLTFSGTDHDRLVWVAVVFGAVIYAGANLLRWLHHRFQARPLRWGYFRLAAPLGLLFSAGLAFLPSPGVMEIARRATFDLPPKPSLEQGSEFLFALKQTFDEIVVKLLSWIFSADWAAAVGTVLSVNMLTGFVAGLYAMLVAELVRRAEARLL